MSQPLRILIVEDSADDAELTVLELKRGGYEPTFERVDTAEAMSTALDKKTWDVILADYSMPHFSTLAALKLMQEKGLDLPFIIVSGAIGEDTAVAAMRAGAHDYLMKDKLSRLVPAIEREIREAKTRQERKKIEKEKQKLLDRQILVNQFTLALGNFRNLDRIYQIIYKNVRNLMDADAFLVSLYDKAEKLIKAGYVISRETVRDVANFPPIPLEEKGHGTQSQVIHTAKPLYIPDVRKAMKKTETEYNIAEDGKVSKGAPPPEEQEDSTNSAIYVPMRIKGEVIGVIQVQSRRLDGYRQDDIALLTGMANVAAIAIQNARLYKGIQQELAERKKAEDALRKSETKFKTLTENVNVGIYRNTTGLKGKFIEANPAIVKLFGYKNKEEFLAIKAADLYQNPADRKKFNEKMLSVGFVKDEELQLKRKDGTPFIGSVSVVAIEEEKGKVKYYDGIIEDITERVKAEETLRENEHNLVKGQEIAQMGYWKLNPATEEVEGSDELLKIFGLTRDEMTLDAFADVVHPEDREHDLEHIQRGIEKGIPWDIEHRLLLKDGTIKWVRAIGEPDLDENGKVIHIIGIVQDITERRQMEEQIARSSRLSAMGEMVGGVAHELNNPLTSVLGNTQWLLTSKVDPKMLKETLQKIEHSAQKTRKIVADLLEFTREKAYKFELANINDIVRKSSEMFQKQADISHIEIRTNYEKDLPPVKVSASHIEQVFLNIMTNASQAMPEGGNLTVITLLEDDIVKVKFRDTGVGIEPNDLDKIFNPFYTKKVGSKVIGTGLGLSMAHKIIDKHKGTITAQSEGKGKGATFTITLPVDKEGKSRK